MNSANMLNAMWRIPACRKPAVTIRHQSPFATAGPLSARVVDDRAAPAETEPRLAPPASSATKAATLIAISA